MFRPLVRLQGPPLGGRFQCRSTAPSGGLMIAAMTLAPSYRLFCFGFGYPPRRGRVPSGGGNVTVAGTTRDLEKAAAPVRAGIEAYPFDGTAPMGEGALDGATHVLVSIAARRRGGDPVLRHHGPSWPRCGRAGSAISRPPGSMAIAAAAGWTKARPCGPTAERARRRVQAELDWLRFADRAGVPVQVFRLAGIYGPGRSVLDQLRAGRGAAHRQAGPPVFPHPCGRHRPTCWPRR